MTNFSQTYDCFVLYLTDCLANLIDMASMYANLGSNLVLWN